MLKVHLDTDLGGDIDDLCALAMLLKWPDVELCGVTTVAEEDGRRAGYTKYALGIAGRSDVPVAAGADAALGCYRFKPGYPPDEEYWPQSVAHAPGDLAEALELLRRSIDQGATVIAIGPLTNLAMLEERYLGVLGHATVFAMGAYTRRPREGFPQWGANMDYNLQVDVESAKRVIEACPLTLIPLEVTVETALRRAYLLDLRRSGPIGELIARQAEAFAKQWRNEEKYGLTCPGLPDDIINFQHDPLACAVALGWDGVTVETLPLKLDIADGWLRTQVNDAGKPAKVVTQVDGKGFNDLWFRMVSSR